MSRHPAADTVTVALASPHGASTPPAHGWHAPLLLLLGSTSSYPAACEMKCNVLYMAYIAKSVWHGNN